LRAAAADSATAVPAIVVFACISSPFPVCQKQSNHGVSPRCPTRLKTILPWGAFCPPPLLASLDQVRWSWFVAVLVPGPPLRCRMVRHITHSSEVPTHMPQNSLLTNRCTIEGFESQKRRIDSELIELRQLLNGDREKRPRLPEPRRNEGERRGRRRWQQRKKQGGQDQSRRRAGIVTSRSQTGKAERKLSAAGRKAISEATKGVGALKGGSKKQSTVEEAAQRRRGRDRQEGAEGPEQRGAAQVELWSGGMLATPAGARLNGGKCDS